MICYFSCGVPYQFNLYVLFFFGFRSRRLDHFHINAKWLSIFTWNMTFHFIFYLFFMSYQTSLWFNDQPRIIYHLSFTHSIYFRENKLISITFDRCIASLLMRIQIALWRLFFLLLEIIKKLCKCLRWFFLLLLYFQRNVERGREMNSTSYYLKFKDISELDDFIFIVNECFWSFIHK